MLQVKTTYLLEKVPQAYSETFGLQLVSRREILAWGGGARELMESRRVISWLVRRKFDPVEPNTPKDST